MKQALLIGTLAGFGALTAAALWQHGFLGILASPLQSLAAGQIFADLVIALTLVMVWIWNDARARGRVAWPWLVATLAFGSFGPLLYLLLRNAKSRS